jgi:hypothetical protein
MPNSAFKSQMVGQTINLHFADSPLCSCNSLSPAVPPSPPAQPPTSVLFGLVSLLTASPTHRFSV